MKFTIGVIGLILVGVFGWFIGSRLSADAIGMAVGVLFGILAGIPAALMVLASSRQVDRQTDRHANRHGGRQLARTDQMPYAPQPPVIILAGNPVQRQPVGGFGSMPQQPQNQYFDLGPAANNPPVDRQFRVVGEHDESIDAW